MSIATKAQEGFKDLTPEWIRESHGFGMAHALSDFNADGLLDLLMIGMPSPTADRLEHLNLRRTDTAEDPSMRAKMTYGNRLYLGQAGGGFIPSASNPSIARSGWSWGCSALDFDNDGYPDVYIANGMDSQQSVRDYEGEYWLHDIYVANSNNDPAAYLYLQSKVTRSRGQGESHGGYEKNRFYLNEGGRRFHEIGHLLGVALESDSRNVVSDDLDGDGRIDLIVTCFEQGPQLQQSLRVYRNRLDDVGNWIGFCFREEAGRQSPVGTQVTVEASGKRAVRTVVTGDSHRAQHAMKLHFGLGTADRISRADIQWGNGQRAILRDLPINQYHWIHAPKAGVSGP